MAANDEIEAGHSDRAPRDPGSVFRADDPTSAVFRALDWSATSLGPVEDWSEELCSALRTILPSRISMLLWWGPDLIQFYNDAFRPFTGAKHPEAAGQRAQDCWAESWADLGPFAEMALSGEATLSTNLPLIMQRYGYEEETYWTFSYSPAFDDAGNVQAVFVATTDTSAAVVNERRSTTLRRLGIELRTADTVDEVLRQALSILEDNRYDVPFCVAYRLVDDGSLEIRASYGLTAETVATWATVPADHDVPIWRAFRSTTSQHLTDIGAAWGAGLEAGPIGPKPPDAVVHIPVVDRGLGTPVAVLALGVSPYGQMDDENALFFDLVARYCSTAMTDVVAHETERERAEALAELDRLKSNFFNNISHEFRTPLTLMLGPLDDALADPTEPLGDGQRQRLAMVRSNGLRLHKMVNDLLEFSRAEGGHTHAALKPRDLGVDTANLAATFRSAFETAGLIYTVDIDYEAIGIVEIDAGMWETIVLNILSNALKYTLSGSVAVSLDVDQNHADGHQVVLAVSDTGAGIATGERSSVFDRFHRSTATTGRSSEGSGIGLALVRELAGLLGGTVALESSMGVGSTFTVRIPHLVSSATLDGPDPSDPTDSWSDAFLAEAARWLPSEEPDSQVATGTVDPGAPLVLVVDDNADLRNYLRGVLGERWRVRVASNGREALEAARKERPDAVVSDVMMPELDGFGLIVALHADPSLDDVPVLLLSARATSESTLDALKHGADDYLTKPFRGHELVGRVEALLDRSRRRLGAVEVERARADHSDELASLSSRVADAATFQQVAGEARELLAQLNPGVAVSIGVLEGNGDSLLHHFAGFGGAMAAKYQRVPVTHDNPHGQVVLEAAPMLFDTIAPYLHAYPRLRRDTLATGTQAVSLLPLVGASDAVVGVLGVAWAKEVRHDAARIELLEQLASIVASTTENLMALGHERDIASALQSAHLGLDHHSELLALTAAYRPADHSMHVGGDWYDSIELDDGRVAVMVGDVVGNGLAAAAVMGQLRAALATAVLAHPDDPTEALKLLDRMASTLAGALATTAVVVVIDPRRQEVVYASAGHPPPLIVDPDGTARFLEGGRSWPVAYGGKTPRRPPATASLPAGSLLLLYTDGLVERRGEAITVGLERLRRHAVDHAALPTSLLVNHLIDDIARGDDDVAVLAARATSADGAVFVDVIPAAFGCLAENRARLREWLHTMGADGAATDAVLVAVGELAANAIDHGDGRESSHRVRIEAGVQGGELWVTVTGDGRWQDTRPGPLEGRGYGLVIVHALMTDVSIDTDLTGTTVTMRAPLQTREGV